MKELAKYSKISHALRLSLIYDKEVHNVPVNQLAKAHNISPNTIWHIVKSYEATGRTNRKAYIRHAAQLQMLGRKVNKFQKRSKKSVNGM